VGRACGETCACAGDPHLSAECECASKACDLDSRGCAPDSDAGLPGARVGVIGSGPAGLTCAADLALKGYKVDMFESLHDTGGSCGTAFPNSGFQSPIVDEEVEYVRSLGVRIFTNVVVGLTLDVGEMLDSGDYQALFIATGAGLPYFLGVPGENLNGVYSANEFLTRVNLMKAYMFPEYDTPVNIGSKVAVVGAGNVAMDSAALLSAWVRRK